MYRIKRRRLLALALFAALCFTLVSPVFAKGDDLDVLAAAEENALLRQICEDYYAALQDPRPQPEDIFIDCDYGVFNGQHIVLMGVKGMIKTDDMLYLNIGGLVFEFSSGSDRALFLAYRDGVFTPVKETFEKGLLTGEDVYSLFQVFYKRRTIPFTDVSTFAWYYPSVRDAYFCQLFNGVGANRFDPEGTMTRAMLVTVLWRQNGAVITGKPCPFTDVPEKTWYTEAVTWAAEKGVVNGVGGGRFAPDQPVTREQFVTILYRSSGALDLNADLDPYTYLDSSSVSEWARPAMRWAVANKIVSGIEEKSPYYDPPFYTYYRLAPDALATRAQAAALLIRYLSCARAASGTAYAKLLSDGYQSALTDTPAPVSDRSADLTADFILSAFRAANDPQKNTVLSPISLLYALGLLANGAAGETRAELERVFGMGTAELNETLRFVSAALPQRSGTSSLHLANSIWIREGFDVKQSFLQDNADYLDAAAFQADFDAETVKEINGWISRNTDGMIPRLIDELSPDAALALANALYFRGGWEEPYTATTAMPFHAADGTEPTAQMLRSTEYIYLHDDSATGFLKPFKGRQYAFAVIVPNEGVTLEDYIAGLDGAHLRQMLVGEVYDSVNASMPKFRAETSLDFTDPLRALGVSRVFDPLRSDLSGISEKPLYVSEARHKAVIDVNELGVSAAAATSLIIEIGAPEILKIATVTADRPYLYMIIDSTTRLPLFIGATVNMD